MSYYYRILTINGGLISPVDGSTLTNFPVLIQGASYPWLATTANGGRVTSSLGYDIIFCASNDPADLLNFERVSWDPVTGNCEFWVNCPILVSGTDFEIFMIYGDSSIASDMSNPEAVWDTSVFAGVYHFGGPADSTLNCNDSTANHYNGENGGGTGANATPAPGGTGFNSNALTGNNFYGGGARFDKALSQWVALPEFAYAGMVDPICVRVTLVFPAVPSYFPPYFNYATILSNFGGSPIINGYAVVLFGNSCQLIGWASGGGQSFTTRGLGDSVPQFVTYTAYYDGSDACIFQDGSLGETLAAWGGGAVAGNPGSVGFGGLPGNGYEFFPDSNTNVGNTAVMDELQILRVVPSKDWVATADYSISYPGQYHESGARSFFYTVGDEVYSTATLCNNPPQGLVGSSYLHSFAATGGLAPYTFVITVGALPPGLSMSSGGVVTGYPTTPGLFSFTVQSTDANGVVSAIDCSILVISTFVSSSFIVQSVRITDVNRLSLYKVTCISGATIGNWLTAFKFFNGS